MSINTTNMSNVMFRSSAVMGKPMAVDNYSNPDIQKFISRVKDETEYLKVEREYSDVLCACLLCNFNDSLELLEMYIKISVGLDFTDK